MTDPGAAADREALEAAIEAVRGKTILFVTGSAKSGTTWTQLWLDRHPEIACRGEGSFFHKFGGALHTLCRDMNSIISDNTMGKGVKVPPFPKIGRPLVLHLLRTTVLGCLAEYGAGPEIRVVGEKSPSTALGLDAVFTAFPEARVLHVARDGRDVAISAWHHNSRRSGDGFRTQFPSVGSFVPTMAQVWVNHQIPVLKHLKERPERIRVLRYEDMLEDGPTRAGEILAWLGVDARDEVVADCLEAARFETLTDGRAPGEVDGSSFFRVGTAGQWRADLSAAQIDAFWDIAGETMLALGYERDGPGRDGSG